MRDNCYQTTDEELKEMNRKCDNCNKTAYFETWHGGKYCLKHFRQNYKYGTEEGFFSAVKNVNIINIFK